MLKKNDVKDIEEWKEASAKLGTEIKELLSTFPIQQLKDKQEAIEHLRQGVEQLRDREQEAFDEKSERWQEGEKGQEQQALIEKLEEAMEKLEEIHTDFGEFVESLESNTGEEIETALDEADGLLNDVIEGG